MCDKAILENDGTLMSLPDCYKNQEMCNKAVDNYPHALEFVPEYYKTHKMCDKAVDTHHPTIQFVPECYKTQEMCHKAAHRCFLYLILFLIDIKLEKYVTVASLYPFLIVYCPDKYLTQTMRDEAVDGSLAALKFIVDWFVTSKMIKKLYTALYTYHGLLFFDEDSGDLTFCCNVMGILSVNLNNINLDNNYNFGFA